MAKKVTLYQAEYLKKNYVCEVYADTTADSIRTVVARANNWGAHVFCSNHFNAGKGNGYEALVYSKATRDLAWTMWKYVEQTGQNYHGEIEGLAVGNVVKYRPDLGVLRLTKMPAVLNEVAYVDNKKDIQDWDEDRELKIMGEALAKGIADYLNLPKKKSSGTKYETLMDMNFRKAASTSSEKLGVIPEGTELTGTAVENNWLKTKYEGKTGYVRIKGEKTYCKKV